LPSVRNPNRIRQNLRCLRLLAKAFGVAFCKNSQTFRVSDHKILRSTSVKGQKSHHSNNKQMKGNMQDKPKQKKERNEVKVRDLKPAKDPKGGIPPPCGPGGQRNPSRMPTAVE
jgi:hypothetical protein